MSDAATILVQGVLGRTLRILGWVCVVGIALVILDMSTSLPQMPELWWTPPEEVNLPPGQFDLRVMVIHPGLLGWFGMWGYLAAIAWIPLALWRVVRASRSGVPFRSDERVILVLVPTLFAIVQGLLRLTPLKYGYPLI
jgi:hypothetical protein